MGYEVKRFVIVCKHSLFCQRNDHIENKAQFSSSGAVNHLSPRDPIISDGDDPFQWGVQGIHICAHTSMRISASLAQAANQLAPACESWNSPGIYCTWHYIIAPFTPKVTRGASTRLYKRHVVYAMAMWHRKEHRREREREVFSEWTLLQRQRQSASSSLDFQVGDEIRPVPDVADTPDAFRVKGINSLLVPLSSLVSVPWRSTGTT